MTRAEEFQRLLDLAAKDPASGVPLLLEQLRHARETGEAEDATDLSLTLAGVLIGHGRDLLFAKQLAEEITHSYPFATAYALVARACEGLGEQGEARRWWALADTAPDAPNLVQPWIDDLRAVIREKLGRG